MKLLGVQRLSLKTRLWFLHNLPPYLQLQLLHTKTRLCLHGSEVSKLRG